MMENSNPFCNRLFFNPFSSLYLRFALFRGTRKKPASKSQSVNGITGCHPESYWTNFLFLSMK